MAAIQPNQPITIAGAGPAGMSAAIVLAQAGHLVTIYEQRATVGGRFNDDYQGLENWSQRGDVLEEIRTAGLQINWWCKPFHGGDLYGPKLNTVEVHSEKPLFYMVRRGHKHPGSLDLSLYKQAQDAGVQFIFNKRLPAEGADILATGPQGSPRAIAAGITFQTDRPDYACGILSEELSPGGYVYYLVADGQTTLATVLFRDYDRVHAVLDKSIETISGMFDLGEIKNANRWGGYGGFAIPRSAVQDGRPRVGEAAGFQDFLFGFGIRSALVSGILAAHSLLSGQDYDALWKGRFLRLLRASAVNRALYGFAGDATMRVFWSLMKRSDHPREFLYGLYNGTLGHAILMPIFGRYTE